MFGPITQCPGSVHILLVHFVASQQNIRFMSDIVNDATQQQQQSPLVMRVRPALTDEFGHSLLLNLMTDILLE